MSYYLDGVIFPSEDVCDWYNQNVNKNTKTLVLPIIHSNEVFREKLKLSLDISIINIKKYNLEGKRVLLFVGRLVDVKNIDLLIKAYAKIDKSNTKLVVIGEGDDGERLRKLTIDLSLNDYVTFIGRLEGNELLSWYNIANIFILPSYYEPFGAVVNEALLGGCYVLCSSIAGASVLVNHLNGSLFDPFDEKELIEKLNQTQKRISVIDSSNCNIRVDKMLFTLDEKIHELINEL